MIKQCSALLVVSGLLLLGGCTAAESGSSTTTTIANLAPNAVIQANVTSGVAPLQVQFSAEASTDPDGTVTMYLWDFGDSTGYDVTATPTHTFAYAASFVVTLIVIDNGLQSSTTTIVITVTNGSIAASAS